MPIHFEALEEKDLQQIKAIYDHYIKHSLSTFFTQSISVMELKETIFIDHPVYKSFLIYRDNELCGFCYITQYKKRQAYNRTAEFSIYLKPGFEGDGIGSVALKHLEEIAIRSGIKVLIGVITATNSASIALCEAMDYEKCAHFKQVGEKFGQVLDVVAYQMILIGATQ